MMLGLQSGRGFVCETCAKNFSGVVPYQQHLESDKHKKKLTEAQYLKRFLNETDGQGIISVSLKERSASPLQIQEVQPSHVLTQQVSMPTYLYECQPCEKTFTGQVPYQIHMSSLNHSRMMMMSSSTSSQNELPCRLSSNSLNASLNCAYKQIGQPLIEIPLIQIPLQKLSCSACKVKYDNLEETLQHYESDDHRSKKRASAVLIDEQRKFSQGDNNSQSRSNEIVASQKDEDHTDHLRNECEKKIDGLTESLKDVMLNTFKNQCENKAAKEIKVLATDDDLNELID